VAARGLDGAVHDRRLNLLGTTTRVTDDRALRATLCRTEVEDGVRVVGHVQERHVAIRVEINHLGAQGNPVRRLHAMVSRPRYDVCGGDHIAADDGNTADGD